MTTVLVLLVWVVVGIGVLAFIERRYGHRRGTSYCPNCRRRRKRGASFCHHCGHSAIETKDPGAQHHGRLMTRLSWTIVPLWLIAPLTFLGLMFVVFYPLALLHVFGRSTAWYAYGASLVSAAYSGYWTWRKYRTTIIERTDRGIVFSVRWKDDDQEAPAPVEQSPTL